MTERVQITEEIPLIESTTASQGQVLDRQQLIDLPNLGRNPFMMSKLAQNVVPVGDPNYNRMEDQSGSSQISIAGGPVRGNNYLLDGIPITDAANRAMSIPTLEAVQEVKVQANTYDAEMARTGGGMFNTYLKSGSNEWHGSLFGSLRQTSWAANNFFNNAAGIPLPEQPNRTFGASFGGRAWIPKVYDGKNRTFFWLAWEGYSDTQSNSSQFSAPTALERAGDFSQSKAANGGLNLIYDPATTSCAGSACTRQLFPGNIIPAIRLNLAGPGFNPAYVAQGPSPTFPNISMTSQYSLGTNNNYFYVHHSKNFSSSIAKYKGVHSLKGGFDYRRIHDDGNDFGNSAGQF